MTDTYYTVAEVAEMTGVSRQAIYKRLDKDLAQYLAPVQGKKLLYEDAIAAIRDVSTDCKPELSTLSTESVEVQPNFNQSSTDSTTDFVNWLKEENNRLQKVLTEKDSIIAEKDAIIAEYAEKFAAIAAREQDLTEKSMSVASQAQTLHLLTAADDATKRTWREKLAAFILGKNKK